MGTLYSALSRVHRNRCACDLSSPMQVGIPGGNAQMQVPLQDLVFGQKKVAGTIVGGRADMQVGLRGRNGECGATWNWEGVRRAGGAPDGEGGNADRQGKVNGTRYCRRP